MNTQEIITGLNSLLLNMGFPAVEEHYYESKLSDILKVDSLDLIEWVINIEKRFGIRLLNEEVEGLKTFADAVALVEKKLALTKAA